MCPFLQYLLFSPALNLHRKEEIYCLHSTLLYSFPVLESHNLDTSYVPRYNPAPTAVQIPLNSPPLNNPCTPFSRQILFAILTPLSLPIKPTLLLVSFLSTARSIILVFTTSIGVVTAAAKLPDAPAETPLTTPVSHSPLSQPSRRLSSLHLQRRERAASKAGK